ncbi:hypothetical protein [Piscirickettsia litoralis]|uniref:Anti-sigma factor NepR domain-containing protein n=1 Tax=Piscirickettsia litoralis TaxID=1891921 RepID=A0ABX3A912_9GAMM|nr:hypothetical protein [Piscirickettsia litoralis]ODN42614.1 hypothetical protein BGC07_06335 [Piscirickettsia litoralis]
MDHKKQMKKIHLATAKNNNSANHSSSPDRGHFNKRQASFFDQLSHWFNSSEATPTEIIPRLDAIVQSAFNPEQQKN